MDGAILDSTGNQTLLQALTIPFLRPYFLLPPPPPLDHPSYPERKSTNKYIHLLSRSPQTLARMTDPRIFKV